MKDYTQYVESDRMKQFVASSQAKVTGGLESVAWLYAAIDNPQSSEEYKQAVKKVLDIIQLEFGWDLKGIYRYLN